jgi:hypothetical protein
MDDSTVEAISAASPAMIETEIQTRLKYNKSLRLSISPLTIPGRLTRLLLGPGFKTGIPTFDNTFTLESTDPDFARYILTERILNLIRDSAPYSFQIRDGQVQARRSGFENDGEKLGFVMGATVALAQSCSAVTVQWEQLTKALGGTFLAKSSVTDLETAAITCELSGLQTTVEVVRSRPPHIREKGRIFTRVRALREGSTAPKFVMMHQSIPESLFRERLACSKPLPFDTAPMFRLHTERADSFARMSLEVLREITQTNAVAVSSDDLQIAIYLPGIESNLEKIKAAGRLLSRLANTTHPMKSPVLDALTSRS